MSKFGFGEEPEDDTPPVRLPVKKAERPRNKPAPDELEKVAAAGRSLGFVSRETSTDNRRRSGRRQTEPQDKILVTGPKRVLDEFKTYCDQHGLTYWSALEDLLSRSKQP